MHESEKWKGSRSVVPDSWRPHGLQPTRLLRPWDLPGKSTGVRCHRYWRYKKLHRESNRSWELSKNCLVEKARVLQEGGTENTKKPKIKSHGIHITVNRLALVKHSVQNRKWQGKIEKITDSQILGGFQTMIRALSSTPLVPKPGYTATSCR